MKASGYYGSKTMKATDLPKGGLVCTVEDVMEGEFEENGKTRTKLVLQLSGQAKGLVLNATNAEAMIEGLGDDTDAWIGASVKLGVHKVNFNGSRVDGIVVKEVILPASEPKGGK